MQPAPLLLFRVRVRLIIVQIQRGEVLFAVERLGQETADGEGLAALSPISLHFGF